MTHETNSEDKARESLDKMNDSNFELDIEGLEDAAGGYVYVDTRADGFDIPEYPF